MATVAELNQLISITDQAINELRERIAQRERSLANVSDKFQANAAYRARLQAEIVQLTKEEDAKKFEEAVAAVEASLAFHMAELALLKEEPPLTIEE